jgi:hypothetical protein
VAVEVAVEVVVVGRHTGFTTGAKLVKRGGGGDDAFENDPTFRSKGTVYFIEAMLIP